MKQKQRYRDRTKGGGLVDAWPPDALPPAALAERAIYVGSAEHKARPVDTSYDVAPALRSDASRCDSSIARATAQETLRDAIRRRCVSAAFDGRFPRYVWGWLAGVPHIARLTNSEQGAYKGWPIAVEEFPMDREARLAGGGDGA